MHCSRPYCRVNAILPGFIDTPMTTPFPDAYSIDRNDSIQEIREARGLVFICW